MAHFLWASRYVGAFHGHIYLFKDIFDQTYDIDHRNFPEVVCINVYWNDEYVGSVQIHNHLKRHHNPVSSVTIVDTKKVGLIDYTT